MLINILFPLNFKKLTILFDNYKLRNDFLFQCKVYIVNVLH